MINTGDKVKVMVQHEGDILFREIHRGLVVKQTTKGNYIWDKDSEWDHPHTAEFYPANGRRIKTVKLTA